MDDFSVSSVVPIASGAVLAHGLVMNRAVKNAINIPYPIYCNI